MGEHPTWSVRALHGLLKRNGIERSKQWGAIAALRPAIRHKNGPNEEFGGNTHRTKDLVEVHA